MPRQQVATVPVYQFGAGTPALQWVVKRGGVSIQARIEATDTQLTLTGQVSPDNITWSAMTVANQGNTFASVVTVPGGASKLAFHLRPGLDKYFRINSDGPGVIELVGSENLEPQKL